MNWGKLAPWLTLLRTLRTALLTLAGLSCLAVAAFSWDVRAGWVSTGVLLLVLEWLTRSDPPNPPARG